MPCVRCDDGKWRWGQDGECRYASKAECEEAHGRELRVERLMARLRSEPELYEPHVRVATPFEVFRQDGLAKDKAERIIEGVASVENFHGDGILLEPAYMGTALADWLELGLVSSAHRLQPEFIVGRGLEAAWKDGVGALIRAQISRAADVSSLWTKIEEKFVRMLSLAFLILDGFWDEALEVVRATEYVIPEIAVVARGADPGAFFEVGRSWSLPREALRQIFRDRETRGEFLRERVFGAPQERKGAEQAPGVGHIVRARPVVRGDPLLEAAVLSVTAGTRKRVEIANAILRSYRP